MTLSARISKASTTPAGYAAVTLLFLVTLALGYAWAGGLDFVQGWGGGIAAVIATWYLIWKTQGYWAFMVVNAGLWTYLFFHVGLPMLAWLQISFLAMSVYGAVQWALVRLDIGFRLDRRSDVAGSVLAAGVFAYSVYAYWGMPGYTGTLWWALELGSVLTAIAAIWMDAFRYRLNWVVVDGQQLPLGAALPARPAVGPAADDPDLPGVQRARLDPLDARAALDRRGSVRMRRGLVFGKFMPLHRGHQLLIDRALAQTDDVTIVVYDSEPPGAYPPMPLEKRLGWLERLYPQAEAIVPVADPLRDAPDADDPQARGPVRGNGALPRPLRHGVHERAELRALRGGARRPARGRRRGPRARPDQRHQDPRERLRAPRLAGSGRVRLVDPEGRPGRHRVERQDDARPRPRRELRDAVDARVRPRALGRAGAPGHVPGLPEDRPAPVPARAGGAAPRERVPVLRHERVDDAALVAPRERDGRRAPVRARRPDDGRLRLGPLRERLRLDRRRHPRDARRRGGRVPGAARAGSRRGAASSTRPCRARSRSGSPG